jgi:hypothetical protein
MHISCIRVLAMGYSAFLQPFFVNQLGDYQAERGCLTKIQSKP